MKRMCIIVAAAISFLGLSAQDDRVRAHTVSSQRVSMDNPVVVRPDMPLDPPEFVGEQPFSFALFPVVESPHRSMDSVLFRFNLFVGAHRCTYISDLGLVGGISDYEMNGLAISGVFNSIGTSAGALQFAGLCNYSSWDMNGCQLAGGLNWTEGRFVGLQVGLINKDGRLEGLQVGGCNMAEQGVGAQIGVINVSERLEGLQIGLFNINRDSGVPVLPLFNFAF